LFLGDNQTIHIFSSERKDDLSALIVKEGYKIFPKKKRGVFRKRTGGDRNSHRISTVHNGNPHPFAPFAVQKRRTLPQRHKARKEHFIAHC
jgi:hypothetical protein